MFGSSLFGAKPTTTAPTSNLFGATTTTAAPSLLAQTTTAPATSFGATLGQQQPAQPLQHSTSGKPA